MEAQAKEHDGWSSLTRIPGFGSIRASRLMGILGTPWRFRTKRQLWRYSGLAVKIHDSSQYSIEGEDGIEHRREVQTRGLNKDGNPRMKDIYKSAAETAVHHYTEVKEDFQARCFEKSPHLAKLDIARKLASQDQTLP
jgi:transposase